MTNIPGISPFLGRLDMEMDLAPPLAPELAASFSSMGFRFISLLSNSSAAYRITAALPFWQNSPYYPDLPNGIGFQCLGSITAVHAWLGLRNFCTTLGRQAESGRDYVHKVLSGVVSLGQSGLGFGFGCFRVASIAGKIATVKGHIAAAARWNSLAGKAGLLGTVSSVVLLVPLIVDEGLRGIYSAYLFHGIKKEERLSYLKKLYQADEKGIEDAEMKRHPGLSRSAAKANVAMQAMQLAVQEQTKTLQDYIAFMKKHGVCKDTFNPLSQEVERLVTEIMCPENLEKYGKKVLIFRLKERNIEELNGLIGKEGVDALTEEEQEGISPIDLSRIEASHAATQWGYADRCFLYGVEVVSILMLNIYTSGAPFLIASLLGAAAFTKEALLSYRDMKASEEDISQPPGNYDKIWVGVSSIVCLASLGTAVSLTMIFSLGGTSLVFAGVGAFLWLGLNYQQIGCIDNKRQRYIDSLLTNKELEPAQCAYIAANGNEGSFGQALEKVGDVHLRKIEAYVREKRNCQIPPGRRHYQIAIERYMKELQLSWLHTNIQPILRRRFEEGDECLFKDYLSFA